MNIKKLKMPKRMRVTSLGTNKLKGMKKINVGNELKSLTKSRGGSRIGIRRNSTKLIAMVKRNILRRPKLGLGGRRKGTTKGGNSKNIIIIHNNTSVTSNDEDNRSSCVEVKEIASLSLKEEDVTSIDSAPPTSFDSVNPPPDVVDLGSPKEEEESTTDEEEDEEEDDLEEDDFGIVSFREEKACIHIQSVFRAHLARRALRALKSLVKLQAVARGVCVRRQARMALHCIDTISRLHLRLRARQGQLPSSTPTPTHATSSLVN